MAASYHCDMCSLPVDEEDVGHLNLRGIGVTPPARSRRNRRPGYRRLAAHLELCPACSQGVWTALRGLTDKVEARVKELDGFDDAHEAC